MDGLFNPLAYPLLLRAPQWLPARAAGDGRLPLSMLVVAMLEPARVVELGVGQGETFAALCQAVQALGLPTQCLGVELPPAGPDGAQRAQSASEFRARQAALFGGFARLVCAEPEAAAGPVADGQVDLLHLGQGLSEAEAARAFERWLPKLSARGVVLVSQTAQAVAGFWAAARQAYPHFELLEGQGMGLLAVGPEPAEGLARLTRLPAAEQAALRELLFRLGQAGRLAAQGVPEAEPAEVQALATRLAESEAALRASQQERAALEQTLTGQTELHDLAQARLDLVTAREREFRALYLDLHRQLLQRDGAGGLPASRAGDATATADTVAALRTDLAFAMAEIHHMRAGRIFRLALAYWRLRYHLLKRLGRPANRAQ